MLILYSLNVSVEASFVFVPSVMVADAAHANYHLDLFTICFEKSLCCLSCRKHKMNHNTELKPETQHSVTCTHFI